MGEFRFPDGSVGWIQSQRGVVAGLRKWSETHVTSSGGGGYLHQGTGHVAAPTVRSVAVEKAEFWLKPEAGSEIRLMANVAVRDGHDVAVVWGNSASEQNGTHFYFRNYSTSSDWLLVENSPFESLYNRHALKPLDENFRKSLLVPLVMLVFLLATVGPNGAAILMIGLIAFFLFRRHNKQRMAAIHQCRHLLLDELRVFTERLA